MNRNRRLAVLDLAHLVEGSAGHLRAIATADALDEEVARRVAFVRQALEHLAKDVDVHLKGQRGVYANVRQQFMSNTEGSPVWLLRKEIAALSAATEALASAVSYLEAYAYIEQKRLLITGAEVMARLASERLAVIAQT